jgi:hypothetical protein
MVNERRRAAERGSPDRPYSALNLRLVLALFGLVIFTAGAVLLASAGLPVPALVCGAVALVALVNAIVVQRRRIERRRRTPGRHYSLFE